MLSETTERVVQPRFDRSDRTLHDFRDLGEVQAVHVVEHDHEPVLGTQLVDGAEDEPAELGLLGDVRGGPLLVRYGLVHGVVERRQHDTLARAPVVREVDGDPIEPRAQRIVRLETREGAMRPGEEAMALASPCTVPTPGRLSLTWSLTEMKCTTSKPVRASH